MSLRKLLPAVLAALLCSAVQSAEFSFAAGRIGAKDVPALAEFYKKAFGMQEINRLQMGQSMEIMLNFGATVEVAKANAGAWAIIMHREVDSDTDPVGNRFEMVQRGTTPK